MPLSFPDMESLKARAPRYKFRQPYEGESEALYRSALADEAQKTDVLESLEIRNKVGWDKQHPSIMLAQLMSTRA